MASWPTLTVAPCEPYEETTDSGQDLLSTVEGGYVTTRRRYSRGRKKFTFALPGLPSSDATTLITFIDAQGCTGAFNWTCPRDSASYSVRFADRPTITYDEAHYHATISLVEV